MPNRNRKKALNQGQARLNNHPDSPSGQRTGMIRN
jgi:hypothetical protein